MSEKKPILIKENIITNCPSVSKEDSIIAIGRQMVDTGYVTERYIIGMLERERSLSVYMGNMLAIPHGEYEYKQEIIHSGLAMMIYPDGIDWDGNDVKVVIGIAGKEKEHMEILANVATLFSDEDVVETIVEHGNVDTLFNLFTSEFNV